MLGQCLRCGEPVRVGGPGRPQRYCSSRCRTAAHRASRPPAELLERDRWVRHIDKRPVTPRGRPATSTDPATWSTHTAAKRSRVGDGLGFVLGDGIACLDLDGVLDPAGRPNRLARRLLRATPGAFTEISPSGSGLHIWGTAPEQRGKARGAFEVYSTGRYITVTGNVYRPGGLVDLSDFFYSPIR